MVDCILSEQTLCAYKKYHIIAWLGDLSKNPGLHCQLLLTFDIFFPVWLKYVATAEQFTSVEINEGHTVDEDP